MDRRRIKSRPLVAAAFRNLENHLSCIQIVSWQNRIYNYSLSIVKVAMPRLHPPRLSPLRDLLWGRLKIKEDGRDSPNTTVVTVR